MPLGATMRRAGPAEMREAVLSIRERRPSPLPGGSFLLRHRRSWAIPALAAVLLGGVGAFDTGEAAAWTLYSYWAMLAFAAAALGALAGDWLESRGGLGAPPWPRLAAL